MSHAYKVEKLAADISFVAKIEGYKIPKGIENSKKHREYIKPIHNELAKELAKEISIICDNENIPIKISIMGGKYD